jgi:peroxiredoxin
MSAWSRLQKEVKNLQVVVVATRMDASLALDPSCRDQRTSLRVALDPEEHLADLLNARWKPRAYLVDPGGRIRYVQPDTAMDGQAILQVKRLLKEGLL